MPRLLHNHNGFLARPNCRHLRGVFDRFVPTDRWQGQINRRLQFPAEVDSLVVLFSLGYCVAAAEVRMGRAGGGGGL